MVKLLVALVALIALAPLGVFLAVCLCAWLPRRRRPADCLLVLGARVHTREQMSQALERRCEAALREWRQGTARYLILCGGQCTVDPCPEAHVMRTYFLNRGVPEKDILMEDTSINTIENLRNAKRMMEERGWKRAALVTSDYHLTRALWIARDVGLNACGIAAKSPGDARSYIRVRVKESFSWMLYWKRKLQGRGRLPE